MFNDTRNLEKKRQTTKGYFVVVVTSATRLIWRIL
jgi:hypothetical protein